VLEIYVRAIHNQDYSAILLNSTSRQRYELQAPPRAYHKRINIRFLRPGLPQSLDITQMNFRDLQNNKLVPIIIVNDRVETAVKNLC
jgi:hypothetical protein